MDTLIKPEVELDEAVKALVKTQPESCTIVHCTFECTIDTLMRIWPSTVLVENDGGRKKLIKAFRISIMPEWTLCITNNNRVSFTLVFERLSKSCTDFYLLEDIPEPGGFYSDPMERNGIDVYVTEVFSD